MSGQGTAMTSGVPVVHPGTQIRALTGLRAIAATMVVLLHFQRLLAPYLDQWPFLRSIISSGWLGVDLFFVLSGFVIARSYLDDMGARPRVAGVVRFLVNRFARVWPAWAMVTVFMGAWVWTLRKGGWTTDAVVPHAAADLEGMLRQLSMTHMWSRESYYGAGWLLPGWSVSAEWLAYLCFPLLAVVLRPLRRLPAAVVLALSCAVTTPLVLTAFQDGLHDAAQSWVQRIACGFTAGILAAIAARRILRTPRVESLAHAVSIGIVVFLFAIFLWNNWRRGGDLSLDFSGVAVGLFPLLVVSLTLTDRGIASFLSGRTLVYGGRISYCLYLTHFVVLDVVTTLVWQQPETLWVLTPGLVLALPVMVLASFALSAALHRWVEEPARTCIVRSFDALVARRAGWIRGPSVHTTAAPVRTATAPVPTAATERLLAALDTGVDTSVQVRGVRVRVPAPDSRQVPAPVPARVPVPNQRRESVSPRA